MSPTSPSSPSSDYEPFYVGEADVAVKPKKIEYMSSSSHPKMHGQFFQEEPPRAQPSISIDSMLHRPHPLRTVDWPFIKNGN